MSSCGSPPVKTITISKRVVFGKPGASGGANANFISLIPDKLYSLAPLLRGLRMTIITESSTPNVTVQAAFRSRSNEETWGTAVTLGSAVQGDGTITGNWYTTRDNFRRELNIGVIVDKSTGTALEMAVVTAIIDYEMVT